jgi:hypothetical protein
MILLPALVAVLVVGCAAPPEGGVPPERTKYEKWGAKLAGIPQIVWAGKFTAAGLEHHRNANKMNDHFDIYEEYTMAIALFELAANQLYLAWELHPEYKDFILWELDKVYGYRHICVAQRPHYFSPTDPLNIYGGALTYEQRQRARQYRQRLKKWESVSGQ